MCFPVMLEASEATSEVLSLAPCHILFAPSDPEGPAVSLSTRSSVCVGSSEESYVTVSGVLVVSIL